MITDYGICQVAVAPVRAEASDTAEIVTQLLFGDHVEILETGKPWIKIFFPDDDYEGYMDFKQLTYLTKEVYNKSLSSNRKIVSQREIDIEGPNGKQFISMGASLPQFDQDKFLLGSDEYTLLSPTSSTESNMVSTSLSYLNTPYLWGGKGIYGIDCSGLTQITAKIHGKHIPRDASQQVFAGKEISFSERQEGDLVFFINQKGIVHHVGILTDKDSIIHAAGFVRIDKCDEKGIYRADFDDYTHHYHSIRRI